jgi:hypothetical protein
VAKAVLIGAIPPRMLKTATNTLGLPIEVFDQLRANVVADRSKFWKDLSMPFYGYNRPGAKVSEGVREAFWRQGMMAGFPAAYFCIRRSRRPTLLRILGRSTCRRSSSTATMTRSCRSEHPQCGPPR